MADILEDWQSNSPDLKNADTQVSFADDVDSTVIRLTTDKDTTVRFTPLVPSVLDVLLEEARRNVRRHSTSSLSFRELTDAFRMQALRYKWTPSS